MVIFTQNVTFGGSNGLSAFFLQFTWYRVKVFPQWYLVRGPFGVLRNFGSMDPNRPYGSFDEDMPTASTPTYYIPSECWAVSSPWSHTGLMARVRKSCKMLLHILWSSLETCHYYGSLHGVLRNLGSHVGHLDHFMKSCKMLLQIVWYSYETLSLPWLSYLSCSGIRGPRSHMDHMARLMKRCLICFLLYITPTVWSSG